MKLAIFDLDGTLLSGDSDALWCRFLVDRGLLSADTALRCAEVMARYQAGTVVPHEYCGFQAELLAGWSVDSLQPLRESFLAEEIRPRIPDEARALLARHREAVDTLILTTATNRVVSALTALDLGVDAYLCTELEMNADVYTGATQGVLNIRTGKVEQMRRWLAERGLSEKLFKRATFYSDSINDLALLSVVGRPVVVDPDPRLASTALRKGWQLLRLRPRDSGPHTRRRAQVEA